MENYKKILILAGIFPPDIGGPAIYSERLARELKKRSIEVAVIAYGQEMSNLKSQIYRNYNFPVIRVSKRWPGIIRYFLYLWHTLKMAKDYDILYVQTLFSAGTPGLLAAKLLRKKLVVKIVGDHAWERLDSSRVTVEDFQKQKYNWRIEFLRKAQSHLLKKLDKIICPSQYLKKIIAGWGVSPEKIAVVYNAAPQSFVLSKSKEQAKTELGLRGNILLSIGRLVPWKGFSALIEIIPRLLKERPHLQLVIVGEGPDKEILKSKLKNLRIEERVKLEGKVPHNKIPLYFRAADIFILNTNYEGFSHVLLEAMKTGAPIITTNIGGNPELITNQENGVLIEYNNKDQLKQAILRLMGDRVLQEKFVRQGQDRVKRFNWQRLVDETLKVFNAL